MQRHHEVEFAQFIESIFSDAAATVRWDRLYHWFGADRLSKSVWQTIHSRWVDLCEYYGYEDEAPLLTGFKLSNSLTITRQYFSDEVVSLIGEDGETIVQKGD